MKNFLVSCLLFVIPISLSAVEAPDSTGLRKIENKYYIEHKVASGEGWMAIGRRYNISMEKIKKANPEVQELKAGQTVLVPTSVSQTSAPATSPTSTEEKQEIKPEVKPEKKQEDKPTFKPEIKPDLRPEKSPSASEERFQVPLKHTVTTNETLFSIAKRYNISVNEVKRLNKLKDNIIHLGQELVVGQTLAYTKKPEENRTAATVTPVPVKTEPEIAAPPAPVKQQAPVAIKETPAPVVAMEQPVVKEEKKSRRELRKEKKEAERLAEEARKNPPAPEPVAEVVPIEKPKVITAPSSSNPPIPQGPLTQVTESGVASWIEDLDINPNKFYALHRTAPVGTIIKVKNRMNNKFVYVKVVGELPDSGDNNNLILKLSKASAQKLNVLDLRFQAELSYGMPEEPKNEVKK